MTAATTSHASIVIPVKGVTSGKSRLAGALSPDERTALNRYLAERTLETAREAAHTLDALVNIYMISPDPDFAETAVSRSAHFFRQLSIGLNAGLAEAVSLLPVCRTVFIAADLPELTKEDIHLLLEVPGIGLAPDEAEIGTNAISVPQPGILPFCFGPHSAELHGQSARETGLQVQVIRRAGLAFDLDTQDDLLRVKGWPHAINPRNLEE